MKKQKLPATKKRVRIDERTEIKVSVDIPDNIAIERYLKRRKDYAYPYADRTKEIRGKNDQILHTKNDELNGIL